MNTNIEKIISLAKVVFEIMEFFISLQSPYQIISFNLYNYENTD